MQLVHWIGVVLALPASAVVLTASWKSFVRQRATRTRHVRPRQEAAA